MTYDEKTLLDYIHRPPTAKESGAVYDLSPNLVAKGHRLTWEKDGVKAMEVARHIAVRAPKAKRVVEWKERHMSLWKEYMDQIFTIAGTNLAG